MKRLKKRVVRNFNNSRIKTSELVDKKVVGKDATTLFKNPTPEEVEVAKTEGRGMVRGLIDGQDVYIWGCRN